MLLTDASSADISSVLTTLGTVVTWLFTQLGEVVKIIMANPLLLIPIGVVLCYTVISVFKRLF